MFSRFLGDYEDSCEDFRFSSSSPLSRLFSKIGCNIPVGWLLSAPPDECPPADIYLIKVGLSILFYSCSSPDWFCLSQEGTTNVWFLWSINSCAPLYSSISSRMGSLSRHMLFIFLGLALPNYRNLNELDRSCWAFNLEYLSPAEERLLRLSECYYIASSSSSSWMGSPSRPE